MSYALYILLFSRPLAVPRRRSPVLYLYLPAIALDPFYFLAFTYTWGLLHSLPRQSTDSSATCSDIRREGSIDPVSMAAIPKRAQHVGCCVLEAAGEGTKMAGHFWLLLVRSSQNSAGRARVHGSKGGGVARSKVRFCEKTFRGWERRRHIESSAPLPECRSALKARILAEWALFVYLN